MIRLVREQPLVLPRDVATKTASEAYGRARAAQCLLASRLRLTYAIHRPGSVSRVRLRMELAMAVEQVKDAQAVVDALTDALLAVDAAQPTHAHRSPGAVQ